MTVTINKPNAFKRMVSSIGGALLNPRQQDSEITPNDLRVPPIAKDETDGETVSLIRMRAKESRQSRTEVDEQTILSLAFDMGKQWYDFARDNRRLQCMFDEDSDDKYWFLTDNQIHPLVVTNTVRATQTRPDSYVAPLTESAQDVMAAQEASALTAHLDRKFDITKMVREWANAALVTSTTFMECVWNPDAEAEVPTGLNPDGSITGVQSRKVGEVEQEMILGTDMLVDPKAVSFHKALWIIKEKVCSLTYIQQAYPEKGFRVQATVNYEDYSTVESRVNAIANNNAAAARQAEKNATILYVMWEKPSPRYEDGRYIVMASGIILYRGPWPYDYKEKYPYIPLAYQPSTAPSVWGRNMVWEMIPHQRSMNLLLSHAVGRAATDKLQILVRRTSEEAEGTQLPIDSMVNRRNYGFLPYTGAPPQFFQPPGTPGWHFELIDRLQSKMENIAGAHDVGNGNLPDNGGGSLSGVSINLLQQADQTKIAVFVGNIESALVELKEWQIRHYRQFATKGNLMRLVGLDDQANPGKALAKATAFKALAAGESRVVVTPGSGMPKTPEVEQQQLDKMFEMGAFGDPKTPGAVEAYLELSQTVRTDTVKDRILAKMVEEQAKNPTPEQAAIQQQQMAQQAAQQQAEMAQQHEVALEHAKNDQLTLQAQLKMQGDAAAAQQKMDHDVALEHAKAEDKLKFTQFEAMVKVHVERIMRQLPPTLTGTMDPTAVTDLEDKLGLKGKVPPVPASKPSGGGKINGKA